jgi:hypothetical protein
MSLFLVLEVFITLASTTKDRLLNDRYPSYDGSLYSAFEMMQRMLIVRVRGGEKHEEFLKASEIYDLYR